MSFLPPDAKDREPGSAAIAWKQGLRRFLPAYTIHYTPLPGMKTGHIRKPKQQPSRAAVRRRSRVPRIPDHELIQRIGAGAYGEVWLARNVIGACRAAKIVFRDKFRDPRPYDREFAALQRFEPISRTHPGLVGILHVGRNEGAGYFYCVMELADDTGAWGADGGRLHAAHPGPRPCGSRPAAAGAMRPDHHCLTLDSTLRPESAFPDSVWDKV